MDIEKLIEQLRKSADFEDYPIVASFAAIIEKKYLRDAATALSTLQAENEKLRADVVRLNDLLASYQNVLVPELRSELEQAKEERDSAISDMTYISRTYPVDLGGDLVCQYCKHYPNANTGCPGWTENDCFEWRGQKEN